MLLTVLSEKLLSSLILKDIRTHELDLDMLHQKCMKFRIEVDYCWLYMYIGVICLSLSFKRNVIFSKQLGFYFLKVLVFVVYSNSYQNHFNESLDFEQYMTNSNLMKAGSTYG